MFELVLNSLRQLKMDVLTGGCGAVLISISTTFCFKKTEEFEFCFAVKLFFFYSLSKTFPLVIH